MQPSVDCVVTRPDLQSCRMLKSSLVDTMRQRCSEVTLQSEAQGHFGNFVKMVTEANPGCLETFRKLDTDEERLLFVSQLHKVLCRISNAHSEKYSRKRITQKPRPLEA